MDSFVAGNRIASYKMYFRDCHSLKTFIRLLCAVEFLLLYSGKYHFISCTHVVQLQGGSTSSMDSMGGRNPEASDNNPDFIGPIQNVTAAVGKMATLNCTVSDLGPYKVGWMKAEDGTILSVHTMVVTHNPRISVAQDGEGARTWQLRVRHVREGDRGCYMCQINTSPMKKRLGCIDVHVPPDILDRESSSDVEVHEGASTDLVCRAGGRPTPRILWKREDGSHILLPNSTGDAHRVDVFSGETLRLANLERHQMGAYLCIATNDVPPSVSKRIMVHVIFSPAVSAGQHMIGVPTGSDARLECLIESYPLPARTWVKSRDEVLAAGAKYVMSWEQTSIYQSRMVLIIKNFNKSDVGPYMCVVTNSIGRADGTIRLYEIKVTTIAPTTTSTTMQSTTLDMEYHVIPRFVVPLPSEHKTKSEVTTYDTHENIIEQSVVDNAWQGTEKPPEVLDRSDIMSSEAGRSGTDSILLIKDYCFIFFTVANQILLISLSSR